MDYHVTAYEAGYEVGRLVGIWVLVAFAVAIPIFRMFQRAGKSPAWTVLVLVPGLGLLIVLGVLAFSTWPNEPEGFR